MNCLGRLFAGLSTHLTNNQRGNAILTTLCMNLSYQTLDGKLKKSILLHRLITHFGQEGLKETLLARGISIKQKKTKKCDICNNLLLNLHDKVENLIQILQEYSFETYLVGIIVPTEIIEVEDRIRSTHSLKYSESIKSELSREIGKMLQNSLNKPFSENPDLRMELNPYTNEVNISTKKIVIQGNSTISNQKIEVFAIKCKNCEGEGCDTCNQTGKGRISSFEYKLGENIGKKLGTKKWRFGMKRVKEDNIDFKITFIKPKFRNLDIEKLKERLNQKMKKDIVFNSLFLFTSDSHDLKSRI